VLFTKYFLIGATVYYEPWPSCRRTAPDFPETSTLDRIKWFHAPAKRNIIRMIKSRRMRWAEWSLPL